jgi:hypothetical protein
MLDMSWLVFMSFTVTLSVFTNDLLSNSNNSFFISHKIMKEMLLINSLENLISILDIFFVFFFLIFIMFLKVAVPIVTIVVANFINIFLFGIIAVTIF